MFQWLTNLFSPSKPDDDRPARSPYGEKVKTSPGKFPAFLPWYDADQQALGETPEMRAAYRLMLASPDVKGALLSKIFGVMALEFSVKPAGNDERSIAIAEFVQWNLEDGLMEGFPGLVWDVLSGGLVDGYSVSEKVWELETEGKYTGKRYLRRLKALDVGQDVVPIINEHKDIVAIKGLRFNHGQEWAPEEFVIWRHLGLYENPVGMSDLRAAYGSWWLLDTVKKLRGMGAEKRAFGIVTAEYADATHQTPLENALSRLRQQNWLAVPKDTQIKVLDLAGQSASYFNEFCKDLREDIVRSFSGAILQSMASGEGQSRGSSSVHKDTSDLRAWVLSASLKHLLNDHKQGIIRDLVDRNFAGVTDYPRVSFGGVDEAELKETLNNDKILQDMGWQFDIEDLEERYGRKFCRDAAKLLKKPDPMGGMPGMAPPPGGGGGAPPPPDSPDGQGGPPAPPQLPTDDNGELAAMLADLLNLTQAAGGDVETQAEQANDDLSDTGWTVAEDGGQWKASQGDVDTFAEEDWSQQKGKRGGSLWVHKRTGRKVYGKENPGKSRAKAETQEKRKTAQEERRKRGTVDVEKLQGRLKGGQLDDAAKKQADRSLSALMAVHGDATMHRLEELADAAEKALAALPEETGGLMREQWQRRVAQLGAMVEGAKSRGVSGWVQPAPIGKKEGPPLGDGLMRHPRFNRGNSGKTNLTPPGKGDGKEEEPKVASDASTPNAPQPLTQAESKAAEKPNAQDDDVQEIPMEIGSPEDSAPAPQPKKKAEPLPPASNDGEWATEEVRNDTPEGITSALQFDPQGDGMSDRLDKVYDQIKADVPSLTPKRWQAFLQKAWDAKAVELVGINEARQLHSTPGALDKVLQKSGAGVDRVLAFAFVKDPVKLQKLVQDELLSAPETGGGGEGEKPPKDGGEGDKQRKRAIESIIDRASKEFFVGGKSKSPEEHMDRIAALAKQEWLDHPDAMDAFETPNDFAAAARKAYAVSQGVEDGPKKVEYPAWQLEKAEKIRDRLKAKLAEPVYRDSGGVTVPQEERASILEWANDPANMKFVWHADATTDVVDAFRSQRQEKEKVAAAFAHQRSTRPVLVWNNRKKDFESTRLKPEDIAAWRNTPGMTHVGEDVRTTSEISEDFDTAPYGQAKTTLHSTRVGTATKEGVVADKRIINGKMEYLLKPHTKASKKEFDDRERYKELESLAISLRSQMVDDDARVDRRAASQQMEKVEAEAAQIRERLQKKSKGKTRFERLDEEVGQVGPTPVWQRTWAEISHDER